MENLIWKKSSRSSSNGGNCVEVATNQPGTVFIRDSKDKTGPVLQCSPAEWRSFIESLRN